MTFDPDDPRLTAYALGELEGDERAAVEALLAESPDARRAVAETRALAALLAEQFHAEPSPGLAPAHKQAIEDELARPATAGVLPSRPWSSRLVRYSLAATLLIACGAGTLAILQVRQPHSERKVAGAAPAEPGPLAFARRGTEAMPGVAAGPEPTSAPSAFDFAPAAPTVAPKSAPAPPALDRDYAYFRSASPDAPAGSATAPATPLTLSAAPSPRPMPGGTEAMLGMKGRMGGMGGMGGMGMAGRGGSMGEAAGYGAMPGMPARSRDSLARKPAARTRGLESRQEAPGPALKEQSEAVLADGSNRMKKELADRPVALADASRSQGTDRLGEAEVLPESLDSKSGAELDVALERADPGQVPPAATPPPGADAPAEAPSSEKDRPQVQDLEAVALGGERFTPIVENLFEPVSPDNLLSTFSIDVDTASYANVRRYLNQGLWPPADAVRIEEMVNYFDYDYPPPGATSDVPFAVHTEVVRCPWMPEHHLLRVALKGKEIDFAQRKPSNLVFLVDVSGSMDQPNKLPLVKAGLRMLVEQLGENDKIAVVVYASQEGVALPPTRGDRKEAILAAIDRLAPGGSTHGSAGINLAYQIAVENFVDGGINRVILATDGDFNVGVTGPDALAALAAEKAKTGVFLNVLGVGEGNLQDEIMEKIANKGNGTYHYLDTLLEARRVLVEQVGGTLQTIAKDVKIQVEFNPARVAMFRLIGYENRILADQDFADDTKDAGEIGSGHTVTALYELVPVSTPEQLAAVAQNTPTPGSRYVKPAEVKRDAETDKELLTVHLRYKAPEGRTSTPIDHVVRDEVKDLGRASADTKFAAAVAEFGMLLRGSRFVGQGSLDAVLELARANLGADPAGRRHEFVELVEKARALRSR